MDDLETILSKPSSEINQIAMNNLEKIRACLEIPPKQWAAQFGFTERRYQTYATGRKYLPISTAEKVAQMFYFSLEQVIAGKIDFKALAAHYKGDLSYIPERYCKAAFSRKQTIYSILSYIEERWDWWGAALLLRCLQIQPIALSNEESPI